MSIRRRDFLGGAAAGVGGLLIGPRVALAPPSPPATYDPYEMVPLGKTGIKISRVGEGTGMKGWKRQTNQTRMGREKFEALLKYAYKRGIRLFDMADLYGTHPYVARALKGIPREKYALLTKIWLRPRGLPEPQRPPADVTVKRFLKELKTDYIDIVLLHCQMDADWNKQQRKNMDLLSKLKDKGVIRVLGISAHKLEALDTAAAEPWVDTVLARINPYGVKMDGPVEKVVPVLKKIHAAGKGVIGMKIIGEGQFRDSDEMRDKSIAFALNLGCVDAMTVGFEKPTEIDDFAARVRKVRRRGVSPRAAS